LVAFGPISITSETTYKTIPNLVMVKAAAWDEALALALISAWALVWVSK
jgi:hypothetical protein